MSTLLTRPPLSSEQMDAAHAGPAGAWLIAAGPGTGKTATMVERFLWLVKDQHVEPDRILALTFTDKAAAELRGRVRDALAREGHSGSALEAAWIGTFHSVCSRLLKEHAYLVGQPREVRVLDDVGWKLYQDRLTERILQGEIALGDTSNLDPDDVDSMLKRGVEWILKLKGRGISATEFRERSRVLHAEYFKDKASTDPALAELQAVEVLATVYDTYESELRRRGLADFDDLLIETIRALETVPEFRQRCHERFRYLLVDEFQDTNLIQLRLISLLGADGFGNVAVVGDAKQSIYGWRDADIENIRSRFPGRPMPLTENHRSYQEILDCATAIISGDPNFAAEPDLKAQRGQGGQVVRVIMSRDHADEARRVANEISSLHAQGRSYSDIAILAYSIRSLPRAFEEELRKRRIPYVTSAGSGFFDRQEVKDVIGLLRLTQDPVDDAALVRVLQGPVVRVGDAAMYKLAQRRYRPSELEGHEGEMRPLESMRLRDCLDQCERDGWPELGEAVGERAKRVLEVCDRLGAMKDAMTVADILNRLLEESGYLRHAQVAAGLEGPRVLLNLRKIFEIANRFERDGNLDGIGDFVRYLDRVVDAEVSVGEGVEAGADAVSLLTVHRSKGLEFGAVFMVNLRPPIFKDLERYFFDPEKIGFVMKYGRNGETEHFRTVRRSLGGVQLAREERRRLVYVGLTRAKDLLYVSATRQEDEPSQVERVQDDHYAEILHWAIANPEKAALVGDSEQLVIESPNGHVPEQAPLDVDAVIGRLERLRLPVAEQVAAPVELTFSKLHQFQVCPVRYRFAEVWQVPAAPDGILPTRSSASSAGTELGSLVHAALAQWHRLGGEIASHYAGPEEGLAMLRGYAETDLARTRTLGVEVEFNLPLEGTWIRGLIDRVCEWQDGTALVDFKTNATLDEASLEAYQTQLRLYALAASQGVVPGGSSPTLLLYDMRRGRMIEVTPDPQGVTRAVTSMVDRLGRGDFELRPEHDRRPCFICSYRPICQWRRT